LKKLLITGSNGFIGSECRKYFSDKGFNVFGIDPFGEGENFIQGEVSRKNLEGFNTEFDYIIHLAGSSTVGDAHKNPETEKRKTVDSTLEVLEFMRLGNPRAKLVYASSSAVYGNGYNREISENDTLAPISEYGKHKVEAENLCKEYYNKQGINIGIIRFFSIYGEGLKKQLLWDFSCRLQETKESVACFGTGEEVRDFIHVQDAVRFIDLVLKKEDGFKIYNCGCGKGMEVREVLNKICKNFKCKKELVFDNMIQTGNPKCLLANISKARELGFMPEINIDRGIERYVSWFKKENQNRFFNKAVL